MTIILSLYDSKKKTYNDGMKPVIADKYPCYKIYIKTAIYIYVSKVGDRSRGRPEGSFLNSYYTDV